ncbi:MAG TPA: hypothetical protein VNS11_08925 [Sphingomicrobium sp.]|nr:hypothetical protein [Sphingomicrobium sp.]
MLTAAAAAFLISYAGTYPQFLLAALGMGIAGGSFAAGVAYVARWHPARYLRHGTPSSQGSCMHGSAKRATSTPDQMPAYHS